MKGYSRQKVNITGQVSEKYSYGKNLRAQTRCGIQPVSIFPSSKVARLFERNSPYFQKEVRRELRREAAQDIGLRLAYVIKDKADRYYTEISNRIAYENSQQGHVDYSENRPYDGYHYGQKDRRHNGRY